jgi:hypothetical protein
LSWNLGILTYWNPLGHSRPVTRLLYLYQCKHTLGEDVIGWCDKWWCENRLHAKAVRQGTHQLDLTFFKCLANPTYAARLFDNQSRRSVHALWLSRYLTVHIKPHEYGCVLNSVIRSITESNTTFYFWNSSRTCSSLFWAITRLNYSTIRNTDTCTCVRFK